MSRGHVPIPAGGDGGGGGSQPQGATVQQRVGSCLMYCGTAVGVSQVLKALFSVYNFKFPFFVMAMQMLTALTLLTVIRVLFGDRCTTIPTLSKKKLKAVAPQALINVLNVTVGFVALSRVNIPLFLCMRRTVLLFVMGGEYLMLGKAHPNTVKVCVAVMVVGAIMAAWESLSGKDSEGSLGAIGFVVVNNCCTALYLVQSKKFSNAFPKTSSLGLMYHQSIVAMPAAFLMSVVFGEPSGILTSAAWPQKNFLVVFFLACTLGFSVSYAIVFVTKANSPLVMAVTGSAKDLITTVLAMFLFKGFKYTTLSVGGIVLSMVASSYYSLYKTGYVGNAKQDAIVAATAKKGHQAAAADVEAGMALVTHTGDDTERSSASPRRPHRV